MIEGSLRQSHHAFGDERLFVEFRVLIAQGNDLRDGQAPIADKDLLAGANQIEIRAQPVLEVGDLDDAHVAIIAIS
jgi:hypothetical protein